ncbi:hypothetical protein RCL1_002881 [Eukaryota sp. TZLM3-RCL]
MLFFSCYHQSLLTLTSFFLLYSPTSIPQFESNSLLDLSFLSPLSSILGSLLTHPPISYSMPSCEWYDVSILAKPLSTHLLSSLYLSLSNSCSDVQRFQDQHQQHSNSSCLYCRGLTHL